MTQSIGMKSLAISVPEHVRTNDYWYRNYPEIVSEAEKRIWFWKKPKNFLEGGSEAFNRAMEPYLGDPFRGVKQRRRLPPNGTSLQLEADASRKALAAANLEPKDIGLLICTSFLPDVHGIGGAAFLARELGLEGAAWNLESACSSGLVSFQTACSLIQTGQYRHVLVVTACTYSKGNDDDDPVSWGIGDAATAVVVGPVEEGTGYLGGKTVHSADTCGAVCHTVEVSEGREPWLRLRPQRAAAKLLRETSEPHLLECCHGALETSDKSLDDVDFLVVNSPLAWYPDFAARALGIDRTRTINCFPLYSNIGPALLGTNLFHAAAWGKIRPGNLVLLYTVGSVSSCSAAVVRWGDVALGPEPSGTSEEILEELRNQPVPEIHAPLADPAGATGGAAPVVRRNAP